MRKCGGAIGRISKFTNSRMEIRQRVFQLILGRHNTPLLGCGLRTPLSERGENSTA